MIDAAATPASLPRRLNRWPRGARVLRSGAGGVTATARDSLVLRLVAFAALAAFAAIHWVALLAHPPAGRVALALGVAVTAAAAAALISRAPMPRPAARALTLIVAVVAVATGALAVGLPARLLAPVHWGELGSGLSGGLSELGSAEPPFDGNGWPGLAILLGLPLFLGVAAALAFWPSRRGRRVARTASLVILIAAYGVGATVAPPGAPVLHGLALLVLIAAWLWLPALGPRDALTGTALVLAAGALALPPAGSLDRGSPLLDYRDWDWAWYEVGGGESFDWNHNYGPIDWPRTGQALLQIRSESPHYWRATVLDQFDGTRWDQSGQSTSGSVEFPRSTTGLSLAPQTVRLNPDWIDEVQFSVRGLSSRLLVGVGTALSVDGAGGITRTGGALTLAGDRSLADGDSYTVRAYVPDPSPAQMRNAPAGYPAALAPYATLSMPRQAGHPEVFPPPPQRPGLTTRLTTAQVSVPWWGRRGPARYRAAREFAQSPYRRVYRLTRRVTSGAPTAYAAVSSVQRYLKSRYSYSETPPARHFPLRAFLFKDRAGYCQQFSGAMALMLRMVGIPSRVATGFGPGRPSDDGTYLVRDYDAHSWVEVYFNGIGWVPFDPTPATATSHANTNGLGLFRGASSNGGKVVVEKDSITAPVGAGDKHGAGGAPGRRSPSRVPAFGLALVAGLLATAGAGVLWRRRRRRPSPPAGEADPHLRELENALRLMRSWTPGGTTLLALENRLGRIAGPAAAAYAARLRAARYSPGDAGAPSAAERRGLRRDLSSGLGLRGRLRGLIAIPPGGPSEGHRSG